jgi:hypothetical protein
MPKAGLTYFSWYKYQNGGTYTYQVALKFNKCP